MFAQEASIDDIQFVVPPTPKIPDHWTANEQLARANAALEAYAGSKEYIKRLGIAVIDVISAEEMHEIPVGNVFVLYPHYPITTDYFEAQTKRFLNADGTNIPRPATTPLSECLNELGRYSDDFEPFVLGNSEDNLGHGKYLIETPEQLAKVLEWCNTDDGQGLMSRLTKREFIRTPGNHYTSWRVAVSAVGKVMSAGLVYSAHTKASHRVVTLGPEDKSYLEDNMAIRRVFEDPYTGLHSADIRSNINVGATAIPLMGPRIRHAETWLTRDMTQVLIDHSIDPRRPEAPSALLGLAATIGNAIGPYGDVTLGIDFIMGDDGKFRYLEANTDQGPKVHIESGYGKTAREALLLMRIRAINSIVRSLLVDS